MDKQMKSALDVYLFLKDKYQYRMVFSEITSNEIGIIKGRIDNVPFEIEYKYGDYLNIKSYQDLREELGELLKDVIGKNTIIQYSEFVRLIKK